MNTAYTIQPTPTREHIRRSVAPARAADGIRTHDLVLTKDALYRLSYSSPRFVTDPNAVPARNHGPSHPILSKPVRADKPHTPAKWAGQDSNLRGRVAADLQSAPFGRSGTRPNQNLPGKPPSSHSTNTRSSGPCCQLFRQSQAPSTPPEAGDGNRTRIAGLEGRSSTIELRPQLPRYPAAPEPLPGTTHRPKPGKHHPAVPSAPHPSTPHQARASGGSRTHNRRFTKPVLYRLSYASNCSRSVNLPFDSAAQASVPAA